MLHYPEQIFVGLSDADRDKTLDLIDKSNQVAVGYYRGQAALLHRLKDSLPHGNWTALMNSGVLPFTNATEITRLVAAHEWFETAQLTDDQLQRIKLRSAQMVAKAPVKVQQKVEALLAAGEKVTQQTVENLIGIKREPKEPAVATTDKLDLALEANDKLRAELAEMREEHLKMCDQLFKKGIDQFNESTEKQKDAPVEAVGFVCYFTGMKLLEDLLNLKERADAGEELPEDVLQLMAGIMQSDFPKAIFAYADHHGIDQDEEEAAKTDEDHVKGFVTEAHAAQEHKRALFAEAGEEEIA